MIEFRFFEIWRESEYLIRLGYGIWLSFSLTCIAAIIGFVFSLVLATSRKSKNNVISWSAATYIELIRNTPLIVQLFFVAFGLPLLFNYRWPFEASALLALSLNFSAYYAEIVRAGLDNLVVGQEEAGRSLSLNKLQIFLLISLPQAIAQVYPSLVSQFIFLFLTTGIISEIGIEELTWSGRFIADRTFRDFEVYLVLTLIYVIMCFAFKYFFFRTERHLFSWKYLR